MNQNKSVEEVVEDFINRFSVNIADIKTTKQLAKFWLRTTLMERDQTSQEREREIVVNEVIEIIESVQLTATKKYADDTTPEKAKVVNEWLMPEVKRNIIEAVKTLTNPNKD